MAKVKTLNCDTCNVQFSTTIDARHNCDVCCHLAIGMKPACAWCGHCNPPFEKNLISGFWRVCCQCIMENVIVGSPKYQNVMRGSDKIAHLLDENEIRIFEETMKRSQKEYGTTGNEIDPAGVNHPKHYNEHPSGIECIDVVRHMPFNIGSAIKYLWRAGIKSDAIIDYEKAIWYIKDEIERLKKETQQIPESKL